MAASERPLLLVDVDGVLSLFGFEPGTPPPARPALIDGVPHWLSLQTAGFLRELPGCFDCAWCTGWEERADEHLPFLLDLPAGWPHVPLKLRAGTGTSVAGHWKLGAIDAFAGPTRPLAWIDDAHDEACLAWAADRPGPTLLVTTEPAVGLTAEHAAALASWADEVTRIVSARMG